MKKLYFFMVFVLLSFSAMAQIRTGGGVGIYGYDKTAHEIVLPSHLPQTKFKALALTMKRKSYECNTWFQFGEQDDIMTIYYTLSLFKAGIIDPVCNQRAKQLDCIINDEYAQKTIKLIIEDEQSIDYLKHKYKIDEASAKEVIYFFKQPDVDKE